MTATWTATDATIAATKRHAMKLPAAAVPTSTQATPAPSVLGRAASQKSPTVPGFPTPGFTTPGYGRRGKVSKRGLRFSREALRPSCASSFI